MIRIVLILIVVLIAQIIPSVYSQSSSGNEIKWENTRPLTWEDFQGDYRKFPESIDPKIGAYTRSHFYALWDFEPVDSVICQFKITKMDVVALFNKTGSWVKPWSKDLALLNHEQHHFDITEVQIRHLKMKTLYHIFPCQSDVYSRSEVDRTIGKWVKDFNIQKIQDDYDRETKHGEIKYWQKYWDDNIANSLQKPIVFLTINENPLSPLLQRQNDVKDNDVQCKTGWVLAISERKPSICVTPAVGKKLVEREWARYYIEG